MLPDSNEYDKWHANLHKGEKLSVIKVEEWHRNALQLSPSLVGKKVLEVGCGTGDFAIYLAEKGVDVTAVDYSDVAIRLAREKAAVQNSAVKLIIADAMQLPFDSSTFDIIFSCECLEHVPEPQRALNQMNRVLKPGGTLILTTENYSNAMILAWVVARLRGVPFDSGAGIQPIEHFFVFWKVRNLIRRAGFSVTGMLGSHHVFLLLPRFHPFTFVKERFQNHFMSRLFLPFARHFGFRAVKTDQYIKDRLTFAE